MKERAARIATSRREQVTLRARTFSQAPQAVRSACSRRRHRSFPAAAGTGRTLHTDKRNALRFTLDIHGLRHISGTAAARAAVRIHSSPSVVGSFSPICAAGTRKLILLRNTNRLGCLRRPIAARTSCWKSGTRKFQSGITRGPRHLCKDSDRNSCVKLVKTARRRGGRVAECGGLLNRCTG